MSDRKNYNSIVFLTTLSVYLGLVLVGSANPSVLAQDSFNKNLQIKRDSAFVCRNNGLIGNEIGKEINPFDYDFAERLIELIRTTNKRIEFIDFVEASESATLTNLFFFKQIEFAPYINKKRYLEEFDWKAENSEWASAAHAGQISELHSLFLNPLSDCSKPSKQKFALNSSSIEIDKNWLNAELTIKKATKQRAVELADSLKRFFDSRESSNNNEAVKKVYSYTQVYSQNNQVFIVTRLPRASIDSLPADKDAQ